MLYSSKLMGALSVALLATHATGVTVNKPAPELKPSRVCERVERERGRLQPAALEHALEAARVGGWCGGHRGIVAPGTRTVWDDGSRQRSWAHVLQPAHSSIARDGTFCVQSCVLRVDCVDCVCCGLCETCLLE